MQDSRQQTAALEAEVLKAVQRGDERRVAQLWERLLEVAPDHPRALLALGQRAFRAGDLGRARQLLAHLVKVDGRDKQQWINLAVVCLAQQDEAGEEEAIRGALTVDPADLVGLILRANLYQRQGRRHEAAAAYGAVATVAPPLEHLTPELRPAVQDAMAYQEQYQRDYAAFLDDYLAPAQSELQGENLSRFRESLDIMTGRKRRFDSQSALFHFHGLAPITFFDRAAFPWLDAIEAQTDAIREEFLAVLAEDNGFAPYLNYNEDQPLNQWVELNKSLRWSAFHLIEAGRPNEANAARCPVTMAALAGAPQPDQPGRTPVAMFSALKPRTRIPPHCGVSNVRLVTHLPLIIPPGCGFRVGNDVREWVPGKAWVFDDTIDHEAWNDSDQLRVILMFDIWHPHLTEAERRMVSAMSRGIQAFTQTTGGFGL
ncbi:aspartyl/asparaginyl beta-hydroxylase domain-containing protein [Massilia solisilvae]|uniref:Aspartyl/asparaginyl beta-hydroxylase domain-containing protein n=1 Tax=Massilia solisilvae TaxID=1811225 RepID=A0ABT2BJL1_9BURK|nr:aspartyl/asparaginyl beta-hydroxylase domain-containing protein [Massilia solisilvae]